MHMDIRKQQLKDDILQRIYEIKYLYLESESVGIQTLVKLADQGERLIEVDSHLSSIDSTLISTKQNLNRMKRFRQRLLDFVRSSFNRVSQVNILSKFLCISTTSSSLKRSHAIPQMSEHKPTIINSVNFNIDDEDIEELQTLVTNRLKNLAIDLNNELIRQNLIIDDLHQHANYSNNLVEKLNVNIRKTV